tara:strand:+ start:716 stop:868 length:153 start_codon:yes stop_codon:yes gene_type:complete
LPKLRQFHQDRLFGTYEPEGEKVELRIVKQLASRNPIDVHFYGIGRMFAR